MINNQKPSGKPGAGQLDLSGEAIPLVLVGAGASILWGMLIASAAIAVAYWVSEEVVPWIQNDVVPWVNRVVAPLVGAVISVGIRPASAALSSGAAVVSYVAPIGLSLAGAVLAAKAQNWTGSSRTAKTKAAARSDTVRTAGNDPCREFRGLCRSGDHYHVDIKNGKGEVTHTIHFRWRRW